MTEISIFSNKELTMTSREIAELVESRHDSVKRTVERLIESGVIQSPPLVDFKNINNVSGQEYLIGKRDSYVVVAQLSPVFTARLVDRWQELESANQYRVPASMSEALRLAADQAEVIEQQQRLIDQAKPAVRFLENYVEARSTKSLREVAKVLGLKERDFISRLENEKIMFRQAGNLLPFAEYQHRGLFEVKTGETNGHAYHQSRFTPAGIAWIAKRFGLMGAA